MRRRRERRQRSALRFPGAADAVLSKVGVWGGEKGRSWGGGVRGEKGREEERGVERVRGTVSFNALQQCRWLQPVGPEP